MFVFSPDDVAMMRDRAMPIVRDNVIFELGLFIGRLGRERNFIISPNDAHDLHLPSDLSGITPIRFDPNREDGNLLAAIGAETFPIKTSLKSRGRFSATTNAPPAKGKTLIGETNGAEQTELTRDGGTPTGGLNAGDSPSNRFIIAASRTYCISLKVAASSIGGAVVGSFLRKLVVRNAGATASAVAIVSHSCDYDYNPSGLGLTVQADTTNGSVQVLVTGLASTEVRWLAELDSLEITN